MTRHTKDEEDVMGDKNDKSKQRNQQQKSKAKNDGVSKAQTKQESYSQSTKPLGIKDKQR